MAIATLLERIEEIHSAYPQDDDASRSIRATTLGVALAFTRRDRLVALIAVLSEGALRGPDAARALAALLDET